MSITKAIEFIQDGDILRRKETTTSTVIMEYEIIIADRIVTIDDDIAKLESEIAELKDEKEKLVQMQDG